MTELTDRLVNLRVLYEDAANIPDLKTQRIWHFAIDSAWPDINAEITRLTGEVSRLEEAAAELTYSQGFQAGLKRGAKICTYHDSHYRNRLEMLLESNEQDLVEQGILTACLALVKKIEYSILWEIKDAPSSSE